MFDLSKIFILPDFFTYEGWKEEPNLKIIYLHILIYSLSAKDVRYICESMNGIPLIICFFTIDQFVNFRPLFEANSLNCTSDSSSVLLTTFFTFTTGMIKKYVIIVKFNQNQNRLKSVFIFKMGFIFERCFHFQIVFFFFSFFWKTQLETKICKQKSVQSLQIALLIRL